MASRHLIADRDLALLGDINTDHLVDAGRQLILALAGEDLDVDDNAAFAVRHFQGCVANLTGLFTEDGTQQTLFRGQLGFTLRGDLADENIARADFSAHADHTELIKVLERFLADIGDITGDLLRPELCFAGFGLILLNVDGGIAVFLDKALGDQYGILVVIAFPGHKADQNVESKGDLALLGAGTVGQQVAGLDPLADVDTRTLVDAGGLVGPGELGEPVAEQFAPVVTDGDLIGGYVLNCAGMLA